MYAYIHIPFCKSKCAYCDFFSVVPSLESTQIKKIVSDEYIESLLHEAYNRVKKYSIKTWRSLYFGGGTPGLLTIKQVQVLLKGLYLLCPLEKDAEVTFEVNPFELASEGGLEYLQNLSQNGINRISCGIQVLDDEVLSCINRRSTKEECIRALEVLEHWRNECSKSDYGYQFSVDLISGLPKLNNSQFKNSLKKILTFQPDHISLYSLILEENTPLYSRIQNGSLSYNEDKADLQWLLGRDMLLESRYHQYEVSNFALKEEYESKHNKAYWRMEDYIGIGCSACGTIGKERLTVTKNIEAYCNFWLNNKESSDIPQSVCECELLSKDDRIFEYLMMGFRTLKGINEDIFFDRFGVTLESKIGEVFSKWEVKNLTKKEGSFYALNKEGILLLNSFLTEII